MKARAASVVGAMIVSAITATAAADEGPLVPRAPVPIAMPAAPVDPARASTKHGEAIAGGVLVGLAGIGTIGGVVAIGTAPKSTGFLDFSGLGWVVGGLLAIGGGMLIAIPGSVLLADGLADDLPKSKAAARAMPAIGIGPRSAALTWSF